MVRIPTRATSTSHFQLPTPPRSAFSDTVVRGACGPYILLLRRRSYSWGTVLHEHWAP